MQGVSRFEFTEVDALDFPQLRKQEGSHMMNQILLLEEEEQS